MLCYPLSAILLLLYCILVDPSANQSKSDVNIIGDFVKFLDRVWKYGNDIRRLLDGCIRIHKAAGYGVATYEVSEQLIGSEEMYPGDEIRDRLELCTVPITLSKKKSKADALF